MLTPSKFLYVLSLWRIQHENLPSLIRAHLQGLQVSYNQTGARSSPTSTDTHYIYMEHLINPLSTPSPKMEPTWNVSFIQDAIVEDVILQPISLLRRRGVFRARDGLRGTTTPTNVDWATLYTTLSPSRNLEDPPNFWTYRNANFVQYPPFFCNVSELWNISQTNSRVSRVPAKSLDSLKNFVFSRSRQALLESPPFVLSKRSAHSFPQAE